MKWPTLERVNGAFGDLEPIDAGVSFFVVMLEALGAKTSFSCEGHPTGFYVAFEAPYELANQIKLARYFEVEILGENYWAMRKSAVEHMLPRYSEAQKRQHLARASEAWMRAFGAHLATHPMFADGQVRLPTIPNEALETRGSIDERIESEVADVTSSAKRRSRPKP